MYEKYGKADREKRQINTDGVIRRFFLPALLTLPCRRS